MAYCIHFLRTIIHLIRQVTGILLDHGRNIDLSNGPDLTTLARGQSTVSGTSSLGNGGSESSISLSKSDDSVLVLLGSNSARAAIVALSASTVSRTC